MSDITVIAAVSGVHPSDELRRAERARDGALQQPAT
jgi:hypothetical protein